MWLLKYTALFLIFLNLIKISIIVHMYFFLQLSFYLHCFFKWSLCWCGYFQCHLEFSSTNIPHLFYSPLDWHSACLWFSTFPNKLLVDFLVQVILCSVELFWGMFLGVGSLVQGYCTSSVLLDISKLFSQVALPPHAPTSRVWALLFICIFVYKEYVTSTSLTEQPNS